jgi:hypothetical protein
MIKICVISYQRPTDVYALDNISPELQKKYFWLCVRDEEVEEYKKTYPHCNYLNLGTDFGPRGVVETRQRVNEMMSGKILVLDDDITLHKTKVSIRDYKGKPFHYMGYDSSVSCNDFLEELLEDLEVWMDQTPHGSFTHHSFPKDARDNMPYVNNKVALLAVWFNLDVIDTNEISYRHGPEFIEDVYMSCRLFELGYDLMKVCKWSIKNKKGGSQDGGCNAHPNRGKAHSESASWLASNYKQWCYLRPSKVYSEATGMDVNTVNCKLVRKLTEPLF